MPESKDKEIKKLTHCISELAPKKTQIPSIDNWIHMTETQGGDYYVVAAALYHDYSTWCDNNGFKQVKKLLKKFHEAVVTVLPSGRDKQGNNLAYYLNRKVIYAPQKPRRQGADNKKQEDN